MPIIEIDNVTKFYGKSRGVEDVSLSVEQGSVFGFLGPNGAGKTTTISMLVDLIRPTSGSISIFGEDSRVRGVRVRKRIGYLGGDQALDRGLTGWQQLEYLGNLRGNFNKSGVSRLAERLNCNLNRKFKTLSRGNKQKIGLIAALMHKPDLLILDEPTSGLDPLMQAEFNKIVREHCSAGGTAFISSHVLSEVQEICDRVAFIKEGKLVANAPITEIAAGLPKLLRIVSSDKQLPKDLRKLPGIKSLKHQGQLISGTFHGDMNTLLKYLSKYAVKDVSMQDADLETVFMKYYEK